MSAGSPGAAPAGCFARPERVKIMRHLDWQIKLDISARLRPAISGIGSGAHDCEDSEKVQPPATDLCQNAEPSFDHTGGE